MGHQNRSPFGLPLAIMAHLYWNVMPNISEMEKRGQPIKCPLKLLFPPFDTVPRCAMQQVAKAKNE